MSEDDDRRRGGGYCRPPSASKFQPGCPPGPGRPKGSKNFATLLVEEARAPVAVIDEKGRRRRIPRARLAARKLAQRFAAGDPKAAAFVMKAEEIVDARAALARDDAHLFEEADRLTMDAIGQRFRNLAGATGEAAELPTEPDGNSASQQEEPAPDRSKTGTPDDNGADAGGSNNGPDDPIPSA